MSTNPRLRAKVGLASIVVTVVAALMAPAAAQSGGVEAWDLSKDPPLHCPELITERYPLIEGGCVVFAPADRVAFTVRTMFGPLPFGRCLVSFNLRIGPAGTTWLQPMGIEGSGACGDLLPCREKIADEKIHLANKLPWKGEIARTSEGFRGTWDLCFDSCMGRFEGKLPFDLVEQRGDWRISAVDSVAGISGFVVDADWDLDNAGVGRDSQAYVRRKGWDAPGIDFRAG